MTNTPQNRDLEGEYYLEGEYLRPGACRETFRPQARDSTLSAGGAKAVLLDCLPFLNANCAASANPNTTEKVDPVATNRNLPVSQAGFSPCATNVNSSGRSRKTVIEANPKQLSS